MSPLAGRPERIPGLGQRSSVALQIAGTWRGATRPARQPTIYDYAGCSYSFNGDANNNDSNRGLYNKRVTDVLDPALIILVDDDSFEVYFAGDNPFEITLWHNWEVLGWGNHVFVDGHVAYQQATRIPSFQRGNGWSFVYNDP